MKVINAETACSFSHHMLCREQVPLRIFFVGIHFVCFVVLWELCLTFVLRLALLRCCACYVNEVGVVLCVWFFFCVCVFF